MSFNALKVSDLAVHFPITTQQGIFRSRTEWLKAVDGVSFELLEGETLGVVGESGCGKSTLARALLGLVEAKQGQAIWKKTNLLELSDKQWPPFRKDIQVIFQDPLASLDPRMTVGEIIAEPLKALFPGLSSEQKQAAVQGMMQLVGILPNQINRYPHEFSGGQCQRIGIARALVVKPALLICDEPVSALDVSIQAQIVNLLMELQERLKLSMIFIAHDLAVVKHISHRILVMYLGKVVEIAERDAIYNNPMHPYTKALMDAVPIPDPEIERQRLNVALKGDLPSPLDPPPGCPFHTRCPQAIARCSKDVPALKQQKDGRKVACHLVNSTLPPANIGTNS